MSIITATPRDLVVHADRRRAIEFVLERLPYVGEWASEELPYGVSYGVHYVDRTNEQILEDLQWYLRMAEYRRLGITCQGHFRWEACMCFPALSEDAEGRIRLTAESALDEVVRRLWETIGRLDAAERRRAKREVRLRRMGL